VVTIKEDNAPTPAAGLVFRTVPRGHADEPALDILSDILGGGESSRLNRELVIETRSAVYASAMTFNLEQDGLFGVGAVLPPVGGKLDDVAKRIHAQVARLRDEPVTEQELTKSRNSILKQLVTRMLTVESKARSIGEAAVIVGDAESVNRQYEKYAKLTPADLRRVAKQHLDPARALEGRIPSNLLGSVLSKDDKEEDAPITAKAETDPPAPGRSGLSRPEGFPAKPPLVAPKPAYTAPPSSEKTLANGLRVLVVPNTEVPFVTVKLGLDSGAWAEPKPGIASLALGMLTKGTAKHDQVALAEELETYAIDLGGSAGMDSSSVAANCLPDHLERTLGLLGEVVLEPTFPKEEFETLRQQVATGLAMSAREPAQVAAKELRRRLYGEHPYAREVEGEAEDVAKATPEDARAWWKAHARPDMATLVFAGDIAPERAFALAEGALGGWKAEGPKPATDLPQIPAAGPTRIYLVDRPGVQSQIRVAQRGLDYKDPGYAIAEVASDYFGGSFSSRLNDVIRVKKGLTYGASGGNSASRFAGRFAVSTFSKTESTAEALKAVLDELKRFRDEPPTDQELATSRASLLGSFAAQRETPQSAAADLWLVTLNRLPSDFFAKNLERIARVGAEDCRALVAKSIDLDHLVIVVVGDAGKLKAGLEAIAPVTVVK
jgi:zinc protease